jgi:hypothetical protein
LTTLDLTANIILLIPLPLSHLSFPLDSTNSHLYQVADLVKLDRLNRLNKVVLTVATERAQRFLDQTVEVLVEGPNPKNPAECMGRNRHNKLVRAGYCHCSLFCLLSFIISL